jgi:hypothetical protein
MDSLRKCPVSIALTVEKLALADMKRLAPDLYPYHGTFAAALDAKGSLDELQVKNFFVKTPQSRIGLSGTVRHVDNPDKLTLDVALNNTYLVPLEAQTIMPTLDMEKFSGVGTLKLGGKFKGTLKKFSSELRLDSDAGKADIDVAVNLWDKNRPEYKGMVRLENVDLSKALGDSSLRSSLSLEGELDGSGNSIETLDATFKGKISKSRVAGYAITSADINAEFRDKKALGKIDADLDGQKILFDGAFDATGEKPTYLGTGKLKNISLATLTKNDSLQGSITLDYELTGAGKTLADLNGKFRLSFDSSRISTIVIPQGTHAEIQLQQNKSESSRFSIKSEFVDFDATGDFDLERLSQLIQLETNILRQEYYKNNIFRTERQEARYEAVQQRIKKVEKKIAKTAREDTTDKLLPTVNLRYELKLKSISELALIIQQSSFNAVGGLSGIIYSTPTECQATSVLSLDTVRYGESFYTQNVKLDFKYIDKLHDHIHDVDAIFKGGIYRLQTASQRFLNLSLDAEYDRQVLLTLLKGTHVNTRGKFELEAIGGLNSENYLLDIDKLSFQTPKNVWKLDRNASCEIGRERIRFTNVAVRNGNQEVGLKGFLNYAGVGKVSVFMKEFDLAIFHDYLFPPNSEEAFAGRLNVAIEVDGNLQKPKIITEAHIDSLVYSKAELGNLDMLGNYENKQYAFTLTGNADAENDAAKNLPVLHFNQISGSGRFPLNLDSDGSPFGFIDGQSCEMMIRSGNLRAQMLEAFAPTLKVDTTGNIELQATMSGMFPNPKFAMRVKAQDVHLQSIASEKWYEINTMIDVTPNYASWRGMSINDAELVAPGVFKLLSGKGSTSGAIVMDNFTVRSVDIPIRFRELRFVDKKEVEEGLPAGLLTGSTSDMRFFGPLEKPKLTGTLQINTMDLVGLKSSSEVATVFAAAQGFIQLIPRADTSQAALERRQRVFDIKLKKDFSLEENAGSSQAVSVYQATLYDVMDMDLRVEMPRRGTYTMLYGKAVDSDQFRGILEDVNIIIKKRGVSMTALGSATIAEGRYTVKGKAFDLRPGAKVRWNEEDILNARLENMIVERKQTGQLPTGAREPVTLLMAITGTALEPQIGIGYNYANAIWKAINARNLEGRDDPNAELNFALLLTSEKFYTVPGSGAAGVLSANDVTNAAFSAGAGYLSTLISTATSRIKGIESVNIGFARDQAGSFNGLDFSVAYAIPGTDNRLVLVTSGTTARNDSLARGSGGGAGLANSQRLEYRFLENRNLVVEAFRSYGMNNFTSFLNATPSELWGIGTSYRKNFYAWEKFFDSPKKTDEAKLPTFKTDDEPKPATVEDSSSVANVIIGSSLSDTLRAERKNPAATRRDSLNIKPAKPDSLRRDVSERKP